MVSHAKIGTSAIQTRATAGVAGATYIFCLPGSPGACRDAWDEILVHQLDYRYRPVQFRRDHAAARRAPAPREGARLDGKFPDCGTAADFRRIALSLDGTSEAPHFDRQAFKVRIYATLAAVAARQI